MDRIPGRIEIFNKKNYPTFVVDFGHNHDGIRKTLSTLKPLTKGKLFCIFGGPGDHNTKNRQQIASIVKKYADRIIITNSNPYNEDPNKILADIYNAFYDTDKVLILKDRARLLIKHLKNQSQEIQS